MEWKKLSQLVERKICYGIVQPGKGKNGNIPVIKVNNIISGLKSITELDTTTHEIASKFQRTQLFGGEIVVSVVGSVGNTAIVPSSFKGCNLVRATAMVDIKDKVLATYVMYYFKTHEAQKYIESRLNTTVQATLNIKDLEEMPIPILQSSIILRLVSILSALDAKIENNNKINANLEAQAEALFKSWFVDFTPFKDQPFVDSELGPIPQGWKVGKADDFYKINIGKTPPRKEKEWFSKNESDNKWISISDMGNCGLFISNSAEKLTNAAIKKFNISLVPVNTILLSFKLTIGRVAISDCDLTTNEAIARFILPDECYLEFSFLMLKLYNYSTLGSTSSIATAVNSKIIKSMKMVMPSLKVLEDFHTITNPLFEKIRFTQKENQRLAALRDTLLPKLMSGEIKL